MVSFVSIGEVVASGHPWSMIATNGDQWLPELLKEKILMQAL